MINKLAVVGVGLIGGSLARALRADGRVGEVVGYGRTATSLQQATDLGVIDRGAVSLADAVDEADMVVLAVPVGAMPPLLQALAGELGDQAVVTDVGSVKASVMAAARAHLGELYANFVPGHPIAGTEFSGVAAARDDLFAGRKVILTPDDDTDAVAAARVQAMWEACGAEVVDMTAAEHDRVLAASSHLPHMLAYCLVDMLVRRDDHRTVFEFSAGGFRDFTRIAASSPEMWRDICLANRDALAAALRDYRDDLTTLIDAIERGDDQWLLDTFRRAKRARDKYID